jgi:hypothetical protein
VPRNITITFSDGSGHRYENIPDNVTPDMIEARVQKDFPGKRITNIDGGKKASSWEKGSDKLVYKNYTERHIIQGVDESKEDSLIRRLKDPESAKFRGLEVWITQSSKNPNEPLLMLFGEINAKNGYGAYGGYREFYALGSEYPNMPSFIMLSMAGNDRYDVTNTMIQQYQSKGTLLLKLK